MKEKSVCMIIVMLFACSCSNPKSFTSERKQAPGLAGLAQSPSAYKGKTIDLDGNSLGFSYANCNFPETFLKLPITRSDWVFSDGKYCCFVTGDLPSGFNPMEKAPVPIHLQASVKFKSEMLYLQLVSIKVLK
jgi:hypothetical protein